MPAAKKKVLTKGLTLWTKGGSSKIWVEAAKKWANVIVNYDGWQLAKMIALMQPQAAILAPMIMYIAKWHSKKLKPYVGPNGIWIGIDPKKFTKMKPDSLVWWKNVDARKRDASNYKKEPVPW